ncbi:hypothetical protein BV509_00490 [Rhodovulum sulfidophilum]|uniref:Uncharacterized protein n=3 Tax=Rhodovulum visakhapatnamense TaxID=364297 RepID=A0ABS1RBS5_9RHOB|nr:hypothetical protein [Rhodovulum visakhapatnamense]MBL3576950.1 hypothetical protein [Rhodovulum visakhapatnamense]OLS42976.1 hypothetical protein BV509_00490 [Rhodovulum sulfidophilum]
MRHRIFAPLLAAALAFGAVGATPARAADGSDVAKALLGATALFVIVNGIDRHTGKAERHDRRHVAPAPPQRADRYAPDRRHAARSVPARCISRVETRHGARPVASGRCLRQAGLRNLPHHCALPGRGKRDVYAMNCLADTGYRIAPRRR